MVWRQPPRRPFQVDSLQISNLFNEHFFLSLFLILPCPPGAVALQRIHAPGKYFWSPILA